jgi:hypothetical protein
MADMRTFWLSVVGGLVAMAVGLACFVPKGNPVIGMDPAFGAALFLAGLAVFGIPTVKTANTATKASTLKK